VIPDLHAIVAGLHDALADLVTAAGGEPVVQRPGASAGRAGEILRDQVKVGEA